MKICLWLFLLVFTLLGTLTFSQSYPVQTNIQLTGPFTNHIPDYLEPGNSKLQVALQITDVNVGVLHVRLKFKLTGPNGVIETKSTYAPPMITLNFGVPTMLDGADLANYFDASNLNFSNSQTQSLYTTNSNIQEGFWNWCVEVYDATNPTAEVLSTNSCPIVFISTNLPPLTNLPICGSTLVQAPTVLFTWTLMPSYLPSDAEVTCLFELFAIPIAGFTNVAQIISMEPIFTTGFPAGTTSYLLNTNEVPLSSQFHYVWRVKVQNSYESNSGNITTNSYMNNGYSIPCEFMLENNDQIAINSLEIVLTSEGTGISVGKSTWVVTDTENNNNNFDGFVLAYRKAGNPDYTWYEQNVTAFEYNITQLAANTIYETKIKGYIGNEESDWTAIDTFKTDPEPVLTCGQGVLPTLSPTYEPLPWFNAFPGIQVKQGQFTMMVTTIWPVEGGTAGHFKGTGFMYIPFLYFAMQVHFDDLEIDDQKVARSGDVKVVSQGLDAWLDSQYAAEADPKNIEGVISSYTFNEPFTSVSVVVDGVTTIYPVTDPLPTILQDDDNKEYQFWPDGRVIIKPYGIVPSNDHLAITTDKMVNFIDSEDQAYPTDVKEYAHLAENYECIIEGDIKYFVSNKSALSGSTDLVKAKVHITDNFDVSLLSFRQAFSNDNILYTYDAGTKTCTFSIPEKTSNYSLYAYYGTDKVGKLDVKVFEEVTKKIRIVPLMSVANIAGLTEQNIESTLNTIYRGAHVKIDATIAEPFNTDVFTSTLEFDNPDVQGMSFYTAQMRALREAYKTGPGAEMASDEYLVFVIPKFANSQIDGYMVRGTALGFVTANSPTILRTLAHELGHGIGGLKHSWESDDQIGTTKNLMDYDPEHKTKLIAQQWKDLNSAPIILNYLDNEEDFLSKLTPGLGDKSEGTFVFTDPGWIPYNLLVSSDVFRATNGEYFQISSGRNVSHIYIKDGYIIALAINQVGSDLVGYDLCTSSYSNLGPENDINTIQDTYLGPLKPALIFKKREVTNRPQHKSLLSNGDIKETESFTDDDYYVLTDERKECKDVQEYVSSYTLSAGKGYSNNTCVEEEPVNACVPSSISDKSAISQVDQTKINEALANVLSAAENPPLTGSSYTYFDPQIDLTDNDFLSDINRAILYDKINLLHQYRSDKIMAYIFLESEDQSLYTTDQLATMAQNAVSSAITSPEIGDKKIALLIINTQKYLEDGWINPASNCFRLNFYSNDLTFIDPNIEVTSLTGSPYKAILKFYAALKKPYRRINIYTKYDYTGAHIVLDKTIITSLNDPDNYGMSKIHSAQHLKSKNLDMYQAILDQQCLEYHNLMVKTESGVGTEENAINFWNSAEEYRLEKKALYDLGDNFNVASDWVKGKVSFDNIKESKLTLEVAQAEFAKQIGGTSFLENIAIYTGNNSVLTTDTYYDFGAMEAIVDPIVYGTLDLVGMIPGVDNFTDAAGVVYAGLRLDGNQVLVHTAALAVPFVGAVAFHTAKKIRMYVRKKPDGTFDVIAAEIDDPTLTKVVAISDEVDVTNGKVTEALIDLNKTEVTGQVDGNTMRRAIKLLGDLEFETVQALMARGLTKSESEDAVISAMYADDKLVSIYGMSSNSILLALKELASSPNCINIKQIAKEFPEPDAMASAAIGYYNELAEGIKWANNGGVYISQRFQSWTGSGNNMVFTNPKGAYEIDVLCPANSAIIECKAVSSLSTVTTTQRFEDIFKKYTLSTKLPDDIKQAFPNHWGQVRIVLAGNPFYGLNKEQFISLAQTTIFSSTGLDKTLFKNAVDRMYIDNGTTSFYINANEW